MMQMWVKRDLLGKHPTYRAEVVSNHYLSLAQVALEMQKLVEIGRRDPEMKAQVEPILEIHMALIKKAHLADLGIELSWDEQDPFPRL